MKIGIVCYPTYGGSGIVATELGLALAEKGHEIHFFSYSLPARLNGFYENVYLHEVVPPNYPLFEYLPYESALATKLVDVCRNSDLDLLHVHYAIPHATVAYLAKKILLTYGKYIPVITTLHGSDITLVGKDSSYQSAVTFSINKSDGVTAVSKSLKQETLDNFKITTEIEVIYNFIDLQKFQKLEKDHFKKAIAPNGERIISHVSNFRKVKRVEDVLYAFRKILNETRAKLIMVGDGPERSNAEELARELKICDHTRFLGKQEAVSEILSISDIFMIPSANESFGLAALEAMACRVPVISSNIGGLPELNIDGKTGYLCDVGDVEAMAQHAIRLIEDPELLKEMKVNAYHRAEDFDINRILPVYEKYYLETITKAKETAPIE